ncbi:hypothetical protein AB0M54_30370 [Actinoplanes sp. NPDC051470]|uniref:hypothetical protein n=1 Tax=unclassified Actinoplanes TaxID=2626549 RepID=UPI00342833D9
MPPSYAASRITLLVLVLLTAGGLLVAAQLPELWAQVTASVEQLVDEAAGAGR